MPHGDGSTIHILDIDIGHMKTPGEQREIPLWFMSKEFSSPDPWFTGSGGLGDDQKRVPSIDDEIPLFISLPLRTNQGGT